MLTNSLLRFTELFGILFLLSTPSFSQYENTIGNLAGTDETADIKPVSNGHCIVLANTTSFGAQKILLIDLNPAGHPVFFKTIYDLANPDVPYTGNSLELDLNAAGRPTGYFITGCKGEYPTRAILVRTDLNGVPTWAMQMDNASDPNSTISECGISLERQSNRDIIAVCRSDQLADLRFTVSRVSAAGILNWSYRYGSTTPLQYIPNESCNGRRLGDDVIAVVGHIHDAGIGHTFLSCIKASNGTEFWRKQYSADHFHDDGTDVVQHFFNQRFFIEGHAEDLGSGTKLWTVVANPLNGNLLSGATYSTLPPIQSLFGRDLCFNFTDGTVAITGFCEAESPFGPTESKTFIMNLPFLAGAVPNFCHYFTHTDPQLFLFADDAIEFIPRLNPGYVLGTHSKLPGAALFDYDVDVLRLNLLGKHNLADCPVVPFTPEPTMEGVAIDLTQIKTTSTWSTLVLGAMNQEFIEDPCGVTPPPQENALESSSFSYPAESLYPNPASAGEEIMLRLDQGMSSSVIIELLDITGQSIARWCQDTGNLIRFSLPTDLREMMYVVKMSFSDGERRVFRLLVE